MLVGHDRFGPYIQLTDIPKLKEKRSLNINRKVKHFTVYKNLKIFKKYNILYIS